MWPSAAEFTRPRGGLYPASQPQHRKEEGEGDRLPLVLCFFFIAFLILVTPGFPLVHFFSICISWWPLLGLGLEDIHYT